VLFSPCQEKFAFCVDNLLISLQQKLGLSRHDIMYAHLKLLAIPCGSLSGSIVAIRVAAATHGLRHALP
jgi:hypothetical protein